MTVAVIKQMKKYFRIFTTGILFCLMFIIVPRSFAWEWHEMKGKHFIVYYQASSDRYLAQKTLRKAEDYYRRIGEEIGLTRYGNFWTWEDRAKIAIFADQKTFMQKTGAPAWSIGFVDRKTRDSHIFKSRTIVTYKQEYNFFDGLLPHEISHLILHDFIPARNIPVWFDEGVAQIQEAHKSDYANQLMRVLVARGNFIDFGTLFLWDISDEKDKIKVDIFYAQSLSIVEFLINTYGSGAFARLCRNLSDGHRFDEALRKAYSGNIKSIADLQDKWVKYFKR